MLRMIGNAAVASGIKRALSGADFDDDAWGREKSLRMRTGKEPASVLPCQGEAERASCGSLESLCLWTQIRGKHCKPRGRSASLNRVSKRNFRSKGKSWMFVLLLVHVAAKESIEEVAGTRRRRLFSDF